MRRTTKLYPWWIVALERIQVACSAIMLVGLGCGYFDAPVRSCVMWGCITLAWLYSFSRELRVLPFINLVLAAAVTITAACMQGGAA